MAMIQQLLLKWFPQRSPGGSFPLVRYFTLTSLVAFAVVGAVLAYLQQQEEAFFAQVQREQSVFYSRSLVDLGRQQEAAARRNLLRVHEAGHVNLTRMFANALWASEFAPLVERVRQIPLDRCRAIAVPAEGGTARAAERRACFADIGATIRALPGFERLDAKTRATMHGSSVFKIKVFDLRGVTVYSSEPSQIGEDALQNLGWKHAAQGSVASELTHRDKFSAFEGVVENRDLISTYMPVRMPDDDRLVGVFEIYSDVTPLLDEIKAATERMTALVGANQELLTHEAEANRAKVAGSSARLIAIIGGLLAALYLVLLFLVRAGQSVIDRQALLQERAARREAEWHHEKMGALATMAAHVSHEVGNPLAIIVGETERIKLAQGDAPQCEVCNLDEIVRQSRRLAQMTRQIADFAAARSETPELVDVNRMVKAVCDFLGFDPRFRATRIEFRAGEQLPACVAIPDHLNECLMNLVQACAEMNGRRDGPAKSVLVDTVAEPAGVVIRVSCPGESDGPAPALRVDDSRFMLARRRIEAMGGRFALGAEGIEIVLPLEHEVSPAA